MTDAPLTPGDVLSARHRHESAPRTACLTCAFESSEGYEPKHAPGCPESDREQHQSYGAHAVDPRAPLCTRAERENERGGEARDVVLRVARALGVDLAREIRGGDLWSPENMERAVDAAKRARARRL